MSNLWNPLKTSLAWRTLTLTHIIIKCACSHDHTYSVHTSWNTVCVTRLTSVFITPICIAPNSNHTPTHLHLYTRLYPHKHTHAHAKASALQKENTHSAQGVYDSDKDRVNCAGLTKFLSHSGGRNTQIIHSSKIPIQLCTNTLLQVKVLHLKSYLSKTTTIISKVYCKCQK